jgi:hypothetical protein
MNLFKKLLGRKKEAFDEQKALEQEANDRNRLSYQRIYRVLANAYRYGIEGVHASGREDGLFAEEEYEYTADGLVLYVRYEPSRYAENKSTLHVRIVVRQTDGEFVVCDDTIEESMVLTANDFLQWKHEGEWCTRTDDIMHHLSYATYQAYKAIRTQNHA